LHLYFTVFQFFSSLNSQHIIGVFDSGAGGLTVLKELIGHFPSLPFIYFADNANCPYGPKDTDEIINISTRIINFLLSKGSSMIVVACNTATASAIDYLRGHFHIPFIGMEPAVKPAALGSKTNSIGILATEGTFNGRLYQETTAKYAANTNVVYQIGDGLVELVEQGKYYSEEAKELLKKYVQPMLDKNIDHLVLGCTHYPFFIPILKEILPEHITIVNPAPAVARQTEKVFLESFPLASKQGDPFVHFYSSGNGGILKSLVEVIERNEGITFPNKKFFEIKL
jgi:glutamate racemase